jgi:PEGA domain
MRLLSLLLVVALVASARADEREERETARKEFTAGQAADKRRAYAEAIEHYKKANELVPHPFAMFNIATDLERIGQLREAATWYEKFLDSSTTKDADRDKVNRTLIDLRNRPGPVQVVSNPDGARVIINGIPTGTTPYKGELKGGMYLVVVQKGNERDSKEITVEYGEPVKVEFEFSNAVSTPVSTTTVTPQPPVEIKKPPAPRGASGTLFVRGDPYGALVHVDDVPVGTLPMTVPLGVGTHTIKVTAQGYATYEQPVSITPNSRTPVDVRLARDLGTVEPPGGTPQKPKIGYIIGGGGGVDAKGNGGIFLGEFGLRSGKYDLSSRLGKLDDMFVVDILVRLAFTSTRVVPYVGAGYSFVKEGYGYTAFGGLRFDIVDGDKGGISLMAEGGYRFYTSSTSEPGEATKTVEGSIVPIMASLLVRYR